MATDTDVLRCSCCGLPFARVQNGAIIVESVHHGRKHVNALSTEMLEKLCREEAPGAREDRKIAVV